MGDPFKRRKRAFLPYACRRGLPRPTILTSMLAAFILVTLPLYIAGLSLYRWGIAQVKNQIIGDAVQQGMYCLAGIDDELARIRTQQTRFLQDQDIIRLAVLSESLSEIDRISQMNRAQRRLIAIQDSSAMIRAAFLHLPGAGYTLHADASYTPLLPEAYAQMAAMDGRGGVAWVEGQPALLMAYPHPGDAAASAFMTGAVLDEAQLTRMIRRPGLAASLLLDPRQGSVLAGFGGVGAEILPPLSDAQGGQVLEREGYWLILSAAPQYDLLLADVIDRNSVNAPLRRYQPYFWLGTLGAAALAVGFILFVRRQVQRPLTLLIGAFDKVREGEFTVAIRHRSNDEFHLVYEGFNGMVDKIRRLIDHVYRQRIYAQQMELKQLQSQINPHFLYNAFFALESMADAGDMESVSEFTRLLGGYFQYITRSDGTQALLREEVTHARNYALLQARRYRNRICLTFDPLPDHMAEQSVPKLLLQPLLENAFEHGLLNKSSGGRVRVSFEEEPGVLRMIVEDNGDELRDEDIERMTFALSDPQGECTGLCNVHRRMRLQFGEHSGVSLSRGKLGGLRVVLQLSLREVEAHGPPVDR